MSDLINNIEQAVTEFNQLPVEERKDTISGILKDTVAIRVGDEEGLHGSVEIDGIQLYAVTTGNIAWTLKTTPWI